MHDLHPEGIPILKTHCTPQRADALDYPAVRRFVCPNHFMEGAPARICVENGLKYLKKGFMDRPTTNKDRKDLGEDTRDLRAATMLYCFRMLNLPT